MLGATRSGPVVSSAVKGLPDGLAMINSTTTGLYGFVSKNISGVRGVLGSLIMYLFCGSLAR